MIQDGNQNLQDLKGRAFELCLAIYRLTNLFPPGEALVLELRQASAQVIVLLAQGRIRDTILKAEEIKIYLAIAQEQNWASPVNFNLLRTSYSLLVQALAFSAGEPEQNEPKTGDTTPPLPKIIAREEKIKIKEEPELELKKTRFKEISRRQELILGYCSKNGEAKMIDLAKILNGVSERTIRNDLAELAEKRLVKRIGSRRGARYIMA